MGRTTHSSTAPFDFTAAVRELCIDICERLPEFRHIRMDQVGVTFAQARRRVPYGVQAKLTPLRFEGGSLTEKRGSQVWTVQRVYHHECELLYLLTFYLPRFQDHVPLEKLTTVIHELYHISPNFDGDIRRFSGRYHAHSGSQQQYDQLMEVFAKKYLRKRPPKSLIGFLDHSFDELRQQHGGVVGIKVPIPRLIPIKDLKSA
ncbi:putative metallopeptidase [Calycomorphotria hydatis]|nr:putative metallopeptidase [Calycomorphotria hydatis]